MNWQTLLRQIMIVSNDANAIKKGKVGRRIGRRAYGKITGRIAGKWFG